jgi:hypothetical protein
MKPNNKQKLSYSKKSNYIIEYRLNGISGFLLSKKNLPTFEDAQVERETLIKMGATEALIKKNQ